MESFLDMMSAERGASANTIAAYRRDLLDFALHCAGCRQRSDERNAARICGGIFSGSPRMPLSASSQSRKLSALRRFYLFLYNDGVRPDNPCSSDRFATYKSATAKTAFSCGMLGAD